MARKKNPDKPPMTRVALSIDPVIHIGIKEAAKHENVNISFLLRNWVLMGFKDYLIKKKEGIEIGF